MIHVCTVSNKLTGLDSGENIVLSGNVRVGGATIQSKGKWVVID
jgi:hypothetical protein